MFYPPLYLLLNNATKVVLPAPDGPKIAVSYPLNAYPVTLSKIILFLLSRKSETLVLF